MKRMEKLIGWLLLVGVLASALIVVLGGILYVWRHGSEPVHYRVFRGEPADLRTFEGVWRDVVGGSGRGIVQCGLMLLVAVQLVRVGLTGALFLLNRDGVYVVITSVVLGLLMYGIVFAGR